MNKIDIKVRVNRVEVKISRGFSESFYLIESNKEKFKKIAQQDQWKYSETLEMLLALHIILEVGINSIFRKYTIMRLKEGFNLATTMKNIDNVGFREKLTMFIYNSAFDFSSKDLIEKAKHFNSLIRKLINFTEVRNKIMHGHAIATVYDGELSTHSDLLTIVSTDKILLEQISKYIFIVDGFDFYVSCLSDEVDKNRMKQEIEIIKYDFIPKNLIKGPAKHR